VIEMQAAASVVQSRGSWTRLAALGAVAGAAALGLAAPAYADAELARAKNCMACHAVDKKLIGPSYKDVALKYGSDKNAVPMLAKKVREGGVGVWGQIPMPANPQVSAEEATKLVNWLLGQK
jgi:cytochrome c